jgi:hypothetical protein
MIAKRMTLDQVKAAHPTLDYELRFGSDTGAWTTAMFLEAVYRNLNAAPPAAGPRATPPAAGQRRPAK